MGEDCTGWGGPDKKELLGYCVGAGWVIASTPKCRLLITAKEYENYVCTFEFTLTPAGVSLNSNAKT